MREELVLFTNRLHHKHKTICGNTEAYKNMPVIKSRAQINLQIDNDNHTVRLGTKLQKDNEVCVLDHRDLIIFKAMWKMCVWS